MMRYDKKRAYLVVGGVAGSVKAWGPVAGGQVVYQLGRVGRCLVYMVAAALLMPLGSKMYRPNDIKIEIVRQLPWVWGDVGEANTKQRVVGYFNDSQLKYIK